MVNPASFLLFILTLVACSDSPSTPPDGAADADGPDASSDGATPDATPSDAGDSGAVDSSIPIPSSTGGPVVLFSDLTVAPNSGWSSENPSRGAVVTIWGRNLGAARGESHVTVNGTDLITDGDYAEPWGEAGRPIPFLQRVSFWLNDGISAGPGEISVTVGEETSNAIPFTVGGGLIYFVDGNAAGEGTGTHGDPWSDPGSFVDTMAPGDIGYFRAFVYDQKYNGGKQNIWLRDSDTRGTRDAPIAFVGYPGEVPVFDSRTNGSADFHSSFAFGGAFITLSKVSVDAHATGVKVGDDSRIVGNDIRGGAVFGSGTGIVVAEGDATVVYGNAIHGGRTDNRLDHGIYISGCAPRAGNELAWNYVYDNSFDRGPMIVVNHEENRCPSDVFVRSHYIHNNVVDCSAYPSRAIGIFDLSWDGGGETEPEPTYVYNNIITRCGTDSHAAVYQNAAHARFYNNTIHASNHDGFAIDGSRVISSSVINNIIDLADPAASYVVTSVGTVQNNLYFGAGDGDASDPAAVNGDPMLEFGPAASSFDIGAGSAAIDRGSADVSDIVRTDFRSLARPIGDAIDIGAVERLAD